MTTSSRPAYTPRMYQPTQAPHSISSNTMSFSSLINTVIATVVLRFILLPLFFLPIILG
jgi:hypothetical protein